jgi:hypothetical protein
MLWNINENRKLLKRVERQHSLRAKELDLYTFGMNLGSKLALYIVEHDGV